MLKNAMKFISNPDYKGLIIHKSYKAAISDLYENEKLILELGGKVNKPNLRVSFPSGAEIYVGSVSQHHDVYKYAGCNFHKIFINEYVNEEDAAYLSARSRSTNPDLKPEVIRDPV